MLFIFFMFYETGVIGIGALHRQWRILEAEKEGTGKTLMQ